MKFKIFSMLFIAGILAALPMIYTGKFNPAPFIPGFDDNSHKHAKLQAKAPKNLSNVVTDEKVQVYRWRDEHGVMQFSNTPPPAAIEAKRVELKPNNNVIEAVRLPQKEEPKQVIQAEAPDPYSMQGMKKVMDDARGVEQMLQQRHEQQLEKMNKR